MTSTAFQPKPTLPVIDPALLEQIDIRVGTIIAVGEPGKLADSEHLVELTVDFGDHRRPVLGGLKKERDDPGKLVGHQALFVVNLPPRKMFGRESQAMLFDIGYSDGLTPVLAQPELPIPNGARAG